MANGEPLNGKLLVSIIGGAALLALAAAGGGLKQTYTNSADLKNVKDKCATLPEKVARIESDVTHIKENQGEIKSDVKAILKELRDSK